LHCCRVSGESNWTKVEQNLVAKGTNRTSRLQITTNKKGVVWFDQVSLMPEDTYKVYYIIVLDYDSGRYK
jgi:alpha-N-arabinofuranosidase